MRKFLGSAVTVLLVAVGVALGASRPGPVIEELRDLDPKTPVIFIPGTTGSRLRHKETGKIIWGRAGNFYAPRDGGRLLALPIPGPPEPGEVVEAFDIVEKITLLGVLRVKIYLPLIRAFVQNGYVRGNLRSPRPEDTILVYPYDWRYENLEATRDLGELLENLRNVRGEETLRVVFLCHSNAARIARWFVKYGSATLEEAEAGRTERPPNIVVEKIIFAATGQGGAISTLGVLDRGRKYAPFGRKLKPEYLFALAGLYEELPAYRDELFFDEQGNTMPVDLFDASIWPRYQWSIYGAASQKRIAPLGDDDPVLGTEEDRMQWLEERLGTARRTHAMLLRDVPDFPSTRYYQIQGTRMPTASRALLVENSRGEWSTLTIKDKRVRKDKVLAALASCPGDRHATQDSQDWLSPQEKAAVAGAVYSIDAEHRKLFNDRTARQHILEYLLD